MSASGTPQPHAQYNGQIQWNGAQPSGAVQPPGADDGHAMSAQAGNDSADAIREGKQRARETMAAAGVGSRTGTPSGQSQSSATANGNASGHANGGPQLSRKRSRDGTQLPLSQNRTPTTEEERKEHYPMLLDRYIQRDMVHGAALNDQAERTRDLIKAKEQEKDFYVQDIRQRRAANPGSIFGTGFMGYGNGITNGPSRILYSSQRLPMKGRKAGQLRVSRKDTSQQAEQHEELVPIRLDIELDKLRLRDTFTWNLHEKLVSPEMFTDYLMEDLKIPDEAAPEIRRQIRAEMADQLQNHYPHVFIDDGPVEPGKPYFEHKDDEMRIQIKLNITIGRITLIDQFEWDINNPYNCPEEFARQMAWENALSGEFTTAIAHSIREQSQLYTKSLYLTNHAFDGRPVDDPDIRDSLLPAPLHNIFRPQQAQKDWMPYMYEMSEAELERTETSMMREHRAQKRQLNRRGGPALPDLKDRQRTVRSLLVHSVIPGAVETWETTGIPKTRRSGRGGRRGARADEEMDSDDLESENSGPESPAPSQLNNPGTARTRGMRGAATAAAAAMRAGYGRSQTPDSQMLATPNDARTSRRSMLRDESVVGENDTQQLLVKLKIGKARFSKWLNAYEKRQREKQYPLSGYASKPLPDTLAPPSGLRGGIPSKNSAKGTPSMTPRSLPTAKGTPQMNGSSNTKAAPTSSASEQPTSYDAQGRVETPRWPSSEDPPVSHSTLLPP